MSAHNFIRGTESATSRVTLILGLPAAAVSAVRWLQGGDVENVLLISGIGVCVLLVACFYFEDRLASPGAALLERLVPSAVWWRVLTAVTIAGAVVAAVGAFVCFAVGGLVFKMSGGMHMSLDEHGSVQVDEIPGASLFDVAVIFIKIAGGWVVVMALLAVVLISYSRATADDATSTDR